MINVRLSDGFGNNLFQVLFAELLSAKTGVGILVHGQDSLSFVHMKGATQRDLNTLSKLPDRDFGRRQRQFNSLVEEGCEIISQYGGIALEGNYEFSEIFARLI